MRITNRSRTQHQEVTFIYFLSNMNYQLPKHNSRTDCWEGAHAALRICPVLNSISQCNQQQASTSSTSAAFGAFPRNGFERYLHKRDLEHLALGGEYYVVCFDSHCFLLKDGN